MTPERGVLLSSWPLLLCLFLHCTFQVIFCRCRNVESAGPLSSSDFSVKFVCLFIYLFIFFFIYLPSQSCYHCLKYLDHTSLLLHTVSCTVCTVLFCYVTGVFLQLGPNGECKRSRNLRIFLSLSLSADWKTPHMRWCSWNSKWTTWSTWCRRRLCTGTSSTHPACRRLPGKRRKSRTSTSATPTYRESSRWPRYEMAWWMCADADVSCERVHVDVAHHHTCLIQEETPVFLLLTFLLTPLSPSRSSGLIKAVKVSLFTPSCCYKPPGHTRTAGLTLTGLRMTSSLANTGTRWRR